MLGTAFSRRAGRTVLVVAAVVGLAWTEDESPGRSPAEEPAQSSPKTKSSRTKRPSATGAAGASDVAPRSAAVVANSMRASFRGPLPGDWLKAQDKSGSSPASERAVEAGLRWLAEHQSANGAWSFDHRVGPCGGRCSQPGSLAAALNGATALAVLPFISHGSTHLSGPYQDQVAAGLQVLAGRMKPDGSLWEPGAMMYSHALGLLALCEDCRIVRETPGLRLPWPGEHQVPEESVSASVCAEVETPRQTLQRRQEEQQQRLRSCLVPLAAAKALAFTLRAQSPRLGGWRYEPCRESDISVTGWHVMGLYSAAKAGFDVPPSAAQGVTMFLNSVQSNGGAAYGYRRPESHPQPTRTAIGLLGRMYTGWNHEHPGLRAGIEALAQHGPDPADMYFNYYATLVLHHYGGSLWEKWNPQMREMLVRSQARSGHEAGSWSFHDRRNSAAGGRHFCTCMALLILETYYRSKPVYSSPGAQTAAAE
jgi:hypothetical protein